MPRRSRLLVVLALLVSFAAVADGARAYNDRQHQGMVALAYETASTVVLERGCASPVPFDLIPDSLRMLPEELPCTGDAAQCLASWQGFLGEVEQILPLLQQVEAELPPPKHPDLCPDMSLAPRLRDVIMAPNPHYGRDRSEGCGLDQCSSLDMGCANAIRAYLAPFDHTGDTLGYWATEPDHDESVTAIGIKPVNALGGGAKLDAINDAFETAVTAIFVPFVCAFEFLFGDGDCLDDARSYADDAIPIEELSSGIPVLFSVKDEDLFTGLWHFIQTGAPAANECDDRQGVLYTQAGPMRPDEIDLAFVALADLTGLTVDYGESTGPARFNITNPGDGDAPSCDRGRVEWEFETFPHVPFSPVDNLALWGWKNFAAEPPALWKAPARGWPLHAIGDAVAPHHVFGTTGWGHRPYEDAAEASWSEILLVNAGYEEEYEQLRRILITAYAYSRVFDELRASRPQGAPFQEIPVRAFVTRVATDTRDQVFAWDSARPPWPFKAGVSIPYAGPNLVGGIDRPLALALYGDGDSVSRTRALLERGTGAILAFLAELPRLAPSSPSGAPVCGALDSPIRSCGDQARCVDGCCVGGSES